MSNVYTMEPRTRGRAILRTSHGPVEIFLWSDESPQAVRNFIQHALNGYYNGLPFHRVLPGVLAQTGDPTRTGNGGVPASGDPAGFPRESHGRLKFRRRGIAAMVADEEGKVRSQFFLTLAPTPWLDGQHTIFGQVQGDTVFNLLNLSANEVDGFGGDDMPRVKEIDVVENPFPDITASPTPLFTKEPPKVVKKAAPTAKRAIKSSKLLSFQDDIESDSDEDNSAQLSRQARRRRKPVNTASTLRPIKTSIKTDKVADVHSKAVGREQSAIKIATEPPSKRDNDATIRQAEKEFERLKAEYLGDAKASKGSTKDEKDAREGPSLAKSVTARHDPINVTGQKRPRKPDESETLRRLKAFESRVVKSRRAAGSDASPGTSSGMAAWFSRGLRLGTAAMQEEEYEVRFGPPPRTNGKKKTK